MEELSTLQQVAIWTLPVLFAITVHEVAHGWVAFKLGDDTAHRLGRITLNPIKHIDPIGTVLLPLLLLVTTGFVFGWAKPVPVNFHRLRQPRRDMALVALAGPGANLLMAIFWALIAKFGLLLTGAFAPAVFLIYMGIAGILINAILMILNLLPILPLDGGRVLYSTLPPSLADSFGRLEPFGLIILVVLLLTGMLEYVLWPVVNLMYQQLLWFVGI
ncbi:MAG: site-2 protease family protein [Pseudomonadota bacterium]